MDTNFALEGYRAADKRRYLGWLLLGILPPFGLFAPLLLRLASEPVPPARVLEKGPTGAAEQQVFIAAYVARAQVRRRRKAWLGFALSFAIYSFSAVSFYRGLGDLRSSAAAPVGAGQTGGGRNVVAELRQAQEAAEAERQRQEEERRQELIRTAEATRAELTAGIAEIESVYEEVFRTHRQAADALTDEWEKRWALNRIPADEVLRDTRLRIVRDRLAEATPFELPEVREEVESGVREAQQVLAEAQERLREAQGR